MFGDALLYLSHYAAEFWCCLYEENKENIDELEDDVEQENSGIAFCDAIYYLMTCRLDFLNERPTDRPTDRLIEVAGY